MMKFACVKFKSQRLCFLGSVTCILSYKKPCELKMSTKCEKCGKLIDPQLEMNGDLDSYVCPECGSSLYASTSGIHVLGKDM
jgi:DNA-directed RNA polymerase subunit RPC12/RpoP